MRIFTSENIRQIDDYSEQKLGISTVTLMGRAGEAIALEARKMCKASGRILILAGKGNNGGDGYAAGNLLADEYTVLVCDVFSSGQRSEAGKHYYGDYLSHGNRLIGKDRLREEIQCADLIIDAIFGTGFSGVLTEQLTEIADAVNSSSAGVLAVDIPLGICSDTAEVSPGAVRADLTVALTGRKPCHLSYPAAEYVGRVVTDTLGIEKYIPLIPTEINYHTVDQTLASELMPKRSATANKGSFGRVLHITGSRKYPGAAHLSLEGALRSGAGYLCHAGDPLLNRELRAKFPEALYCDFEENADHVSQILDISHSYSSVLLGCGSGVSETVAELCVGLIEMEGAPLILDAGALNSIAKYSTPDVFRGKRRPVILTPHPLELSRLSGISVGDINSGRIKVAEQFASDYGVILLLKGAGTVITDGERTFINETGSSALAKAGSGDVLSGIASALVATEGDLLSRVALAAYLHGRAADELSLTLSEFGVLPSDLPRKVCEIIVNLYH